jgi:UDP-N-acetylmuramoyl-tripeptide--D-alanyl-D-alanine ligase
MAGAGRRSWAVLGEMLELGDLAADEHAAIGRSAAELGVDEIVGVGEPAASSIAAGAPATRAVADSAAAIALLRAEVRPGDVVLVKASRSVGLDAVAAALLDTSSDGPLDGRLRAGRDGVPVRRPAAPPGEDGPQPAGRAGGLIGGEARA